MRESNWSAARDGRRRLPACPRCQDDGQITREQDGSLSCANCAHNWREA